MHTFFDHDKLCQIEGVELLRVSFPIIMVGAVLSYELYITFWGCVPRINNWVCYQTTQNEN